MRAFAVAAAFALAFVPATVEATWMAVGGAEPSTWQDRRHGLMFLEPADNASEPAGVYFQAFQAVEGLTFQPNVALLDGRLLAPGPVHHRALLGYWKDCNRDGYVGLAESAILDYSASLLLDEDVCPRGSDQNDGAWVSEMIGIGMVDPCERATDEHRAMHCPGVDAYHVNERAFYAPGTMVWGDVGAPGEVPGAECPLAPPPGTTSGTGAFLAYADCQDARLVARTVNAVDRDGALGLRFEDEEHPERSTSRLNQPFPVTLFGGPQGPGLLQAESGARAATVWDCARPTENSVDDPTGGSLSEVVVQDPTGTRLTGRRSGIPIIGTLTLFEDHDGDSTTPGERRERLANEDGALVWAPAVAPGAPAPTGSWWDAAEHAADGPRGDCDPSTQSALRPLEPAAIVEGGDPQVDAGRKDRSSLAFKWYDGHRGLNDTIDPLLGPTAPSDGGLVLLRHGRGGVGPLWSADAASANEPQLVTRGSLDLSRPLRWTYYAALGADVFDIGVRIPNGGAPRQYASEACGSDLTGERNGWICDPALWWRDAFGRDVRPRYAEGTVPYAPVPGQTYHLRDVDCYDGHVGAGVFASGALVNGETCADEPDEG